MQSFEAFVAALGGRYRFVSAVGEGGMATVLRVRDEQLGRDVAFKVLKPDLSAVLGAERFLQEVRVTAGLQHPHILPLFDSGAHDGRLWYAMPFVPGESLRERVARQGRLACAEALRIAEQVAAALAYAHEQGVVHRDIKPENLLLANDNVYVTDFGIALAVSRADSGRLTESGILLGTPAYMSPEQASGERELDGHTDQWALCAVLYEMLAGEPPHRGASVQTLLTRILLETPTPLRTVRPSVPTHVDAAVMRGLEKEPTARFPSLREFRQALAPPPLSVAADHAVVTPEAARSARETVAPGAPLPSRRSWATAVVLLCVALLAFWTRERWTRPGLGTGDGLLVIAVVPCEDRTTAPELAYVADGFSENLVNRLTGISGLRVLPRREVRDAAARGGRPSEIAVALGATHIVTCSVGPAADGLRIGAQLVQAQPARELWADGLVGPAQELLAIEDSLLRVFVASVPVRISDDEQRTLSEGDTRSGEAQRLFLLGRHHWHRMTVPEMQLALHYFEQALEQDSTYARAHAGVAMVNIPLALGIGTQDPAVALTGAREAIARGLTHRPADPDLLAMRAMVSLWFDRDIAAAERDARAALQRAPSLYVTQQTMQHVLAAQGRLDDALAANEQARRADPTFGRLLVDRAGYEFLARRYREARASADAAIDLDPASVSGFLWRAHAQAMLGEDAGAYASLARAAQLALGSTFLNTERAVVLALMGDATTARRLLDSLERAPGRVEPVLLAAARGLVGDHDRAFALLDSALLANSRWLLTVPVDPRFDTMREDPRFARFVARMQRGD